MSTVCYANAAMSYRAAFVHRLLRALQSSVGAVYYRIRYPETNAPLR